MSEARADTNAVVIPSPTIRNRLSLFLQLAPPTISKSKPTYPRRSVTLGKKSSRKETLTGFSSVVSSASVKQPFHSTASTASFADSLASTPHEALLKSHSTDGLLAPLPSVPLSAPVPPTTNELDFEEKMRLLKKVRKLSRMLGEYPLPVSEDNAGVGSGVIRLEGQVIPEDSYLEPVSAPTTSQSDTKKAQRKSYRHSWTIGYSTAISTPPSPEPTTSSNSPMSPIEFAWPSSTSHPIESTPLPSPPIRTRSLEMTSSHSDEDKDIGTPLGSRRFSAGSASSYFPPEKTPEQMQRARAARITRHLGDDVPPELLFRAASPPLRQVSPPLSPVSLSHTLPMAAPVLPSLPHASTVSTSSRSLPSRSASLRRKKGNETCNKRLSLDLKALAITASAPSTPSISTSNTARLSTSTGVSKADKKLMRRSKSMWVRKVFLDGSAPSDESVAKESASPVRESFDTGNLSISEPMSERERVMNVRRAKKMTQYFGDKPPTALFQITNFSHGVPSLDTGDHRLRRDSLATIISISSSLSVAPLGGRAARDSYMSMSSVVSPNSAPSPADPKVTATTAVDQDDVDQDHDSGASEDGDHEETQYVFPLPPSTPPPTSPDFTMSRSLSPPLSPLSSTILSVYHAPSSPRTPPPFSDIISPPPRTSASRTRTPSALPAQEPEQVGKTSLEFHTRQRRAAKLSKFFGVEMNTLAEVLPTNPRKSSPSTSFEHPPSSPGRRSDQKLVTESDAALSISVTKNEPNSPPRVEISTEPAKGPLRFLHGQNGARELDVYDAIDKLRRMKSV